MSVSEARRAPVQRRASTPPRRTPWENLQRFLRTPKGTLTWVLLALIAAAMVDTTRNTLPVVAAAVAGAAAVDVAATRLRQGKFLFPSGAVLTGLIVAMVLARETPFYAALLTAALAAGLKHAIRTRWSNVFNPAVLGLLVGVVLFHSGQSWWGALPYYPVLGFLLVGVAGWYIAAKVNKLPLALMYLGVSVVVFTVASFAGDAAQVAQVFRAPDINALVFFACIMLADPPTSPARHRDQLWFGAAAGLIGALIFLRFGVQWFLMAGLPAVNIAESLRRVAARPKTAARPATPSGTAPGGTTNRGPRTASGDRAPALAATARPSTGPARAGAPRPGSGLPDRSGRKAGASSSPGAGKRPESGRA